MKKAFQFSKKNAGKAFMLFCVMSSFIFSSCEKECEKVRVQFRNEYSSQTIKLYINNSQSATLVPGEIVARDVRPGSIKIRFESMGGSALCHGDSYVGCDDDYLKQFRCPQ